MNRHYIEKIPPKGVNADGADGKQGGKVFSIQLFSFKKAPMQVKGSKYDKYRDELAAKLGDKLV